MGFLGYGRIEVRQYLALEEGVRIGKICGWVENMIFDSIVGGFSLFVHTSFYIIRGDLISRLDFDWARSILDFSG